MSDDSGYMDVTNSAMDDFLDDGSDGSSDNESVTSSSTKKNIRPVHNIGQACKFCKKRHIRCDGAFPCTQCVKRNLQCTFGTKTKRGPKPKTDLYEHCNKLMVDLEVQKQIAEYWREQFMTAMRKHGKDGNEFVEEHGLHPPAMAAELDRLSASSGLTSSDTAGLISTGASSPSGSSPPIKDEAGSLIPGFGNNLRISSTPTPSHEMSLITASAAGTSTSASPAPYVPHVTHRDPKPVLTLDQISNMFTLFSTHILPLVPDYNIVFHPDIALAAWNSTKSERDELKDHGTLTDMFEHCVISAHGFRLSNEADIMHRFAKKAEDLLQLLFFQRESQCQPELAQKLVQVLILLSFYYGGDDRDGSKQSVIMLAYQIISMHRTFIAPATMHRVYYTMMSLSENQADRVYWFNQASSLATQMKIKSLASITAASMMFIFSSLHPKANFDQAPPPFTKPQLMAFLKKIDEARNHFTGTGTTPDGIPLNAEAISTFSVLMNGCRSELLFLLGEFASAQTTAQWTIDAGASLQRPVHISMFGIQCAAEVALAMHMTPATQSALATFERHSHALPIANRFRRRIMSQINLQQPLADGVASGGNAAGLLSSSSDMLQQDYLQSNLMNEDYTLNGLGIHPMPSSDPHYPLQNALAGGAPPGSSAPSALGSSSVSNGGRLSSSIGAPRTPAGHQTLRMSGTAQNDDMMAMYSDDYPNFS